MQRIFTLTLIHQIPKFYNDIAIRCDQYGNLIPLKNDSCMLCVCSRTLLE